jgi:WD40 repeat protein
MTAEFSSGYEHDPPPLSAVVYDAKRFLLSHSSIIERAPLQTYCSALVFSPEASIIRRLYKRHLPEWIVRAPALSEDWGLHFQTLSHSYSVNAVAFSPDSQLIVSGSSDSTVRVCDAATGAERRVLRGHSYSVNAVVFSPDGRLIVSGSSDETVRVWDAATGAERHVLRIDTALGFLSFSSCGKHLVTDRGTLRLPYSDCRCSHHILATVAFSPDGNHASVGFRRQDHPALGYGNRGSPADARGAWQLCQGSGVLAGRQHTSVGFMGSDHPALGYGDRGAPADARGAW